MRRRNGSVCALSLLLAFGLAACGSSQDTGAQTAENGGADAQVQENAETDAASQETASATEENEVGELPAELDFTVNYDGIKTSKIAAGVSVHDPSIYKVDGKYYIFGSHMSTAVSEDLRTWTSLGDGYKVKDQIYYELMANEDAFAYSGKEEEPDSHRRQGVACVGAGCDLQ